LDSSGLGEGEVDTEEVEFRRIDAKALLIMLIGGAGMGG